MAKFEKVSRFADVDILTPRRKTAFSAGYDFVAAETITIPSIVKHYLDMEEDFKNNPCVNLEEMAKITKKLGAKPTLVSTGMKCQLDPGTYLELSVRSSTPLKYWIILANGVGIIDRDYWNNSSNEGEIFFQLINLSPFDITIQKGDVLGQGIIKSYGITEDDVAEGERAGGFGSTDA